MALHRDWLSCPVWAVLVAVKAGVLITLNLIHGYADYVGSKALKSAQHGVEGAAAGLVGACDDQHTVHGGCHVKRFREGEQRGRINDNQVEFPLRQGEELGEHAA